MYHAENENKPIPSTHSYPHITPHSLIDSFRTFKYHGTTVLHITCPVSWRDLAGILSHHRILDIVLERACYAARSCPSRHRKKKFVSIPWTISISPCGIFRLLFICGVGCLSQGKEGQKRSNLRRKRVPTRWIPGVVIPSQCSCTFLIHLKNDTEALIRKGHLCHNLK